MLAQSPPKIDACCPDYLSRGSRSFLFVRGDQRERMLRVIVLERKREGGSAQPGLELIEVPG